MDVSAEPMQTNQQIYILSTAALTYWTKNYLGDATPDPWNAPLTALDEHWSGPPVDEVLVTYGEDELLRDDIAKFCEKLEVSWGSASQNSFHANTRQEDLSWKSDYVEISRGSS